MSYFIVIVRSFQGIKAALLFARLMEKKSIEILVVKKSGDTEKQVSTDGQSFKKYQLD